MSDLCEQLADVYSSHYCSLYGGQIPTVLVTNEGGMYTLVVYKTKERGWDRNYVVGGFSFTRGEAMKLVMRYRKVLAIIDLARSKNECLALPDFRHYCDVCINPAGHVFSWRPWIRKVAAELIKGDTDERHRFA